MSKYISFNGEILTAEQVMLAYDNRSFRYGDGLFETMRMVNGQILFLNLHSERLSKGMQILRFSNISIFNKDFIESSILSLAHKNKIHKDARVRLTVFRNDGGYYTPQKNTFSYIIEIDAIDAGSYVLNRKGLIIDVYDGVRKDPGILSSFKTNNALVYVLAGICKAEAGIDECILLNSKGNMVEGISSNLFIVKKDTLYTPAISEGCIDGVMRNVIIRLAKKNGMQVSESVLNPDLILQSDEIFMTNALHGIQWVVGYREKRFFSKYSKILSEQLINLKTETL